MIEGDVSMCVPFIAKRVFKNFLFRKNHWKSSHRGEAENDSSLEK